MNISRFFLYSNLAGGFLISFVYVGKIISLPLILDTVIVVAKWKVLLASQAK